MATPRPYISTSSPLPAVTSVKVPLRLLWYRAGRERRPLGVQSLLLISRMSGQPSPSKSKKAHPEPRVSGSHFFPALPLLCTNLMPAAVVTSVNWTWPVGVLVASSAARPRNAQFIDCLQRPRKAAAPAHPAGGRFRDRGCFAVRYCLRG